MMKKWLVRILSLIIAIALSVMIFGFSAQTGEKSGNLSHEISEAILTEIYKPEEVPPQKTESFESFLRKAAHYFEYFLLGATWLAFFSTFTFKRRLCSLLAVGISAVYAASDEWHQSFVPDRGPSVLDVLLDTFGALCGVLLLLWLFGRFFFPNESRRKISEKKK